MPGILTRGSMPGWFWNQSVQNADYRPLQTIVFTMQSERDKNSPTDCFLTLKYNGLLSVCSLHFVLSSFGMGTATPLVH